MGVKRSVADFSNKHQKLVYENWQQRLTEQNVLGYHKNVSLHSALIETKLSTQADQLGLCLIEKGLLQNTNRVKRSDLFFDRKEANEILNREKRGWGGFKIKIPKIRISNPLEQLEENVGKKIYHGVKDGWENMEENVGKPIYKGAKQLSLENLEEKVGKKIHHGVKDGWENLEENVGKPIYKGAKQLSLENLEENVGKKISPDVNDGWENLEETIGNPIYNFAHEKVCESSGYHECKEKISEAKKAGTESGINVEIDIFDSGMFSAFQDAFKILSGIITAFGHPKNPDIDEPFIRMKRSDTRTTYFSMIGYDLKNHLDPNEEHGIIDPVAAIYKLAFLSNYNDREYSMVDYAKIFYNQTYLPEYKPCFEEFYSGLNSLIFERLEEIFPGLIDAVTEACSNNKENLNPYSPLPELCELNELLGTHGFRADFIYNDDKQASWDKGLDTIGYLYRIFDYDNNYILRFDEILKKIISLKLNL